MSSISLLQALNVRALNSIQHARFLNFPGNPIHNKNFIYASYDLTGVGWDAATVNRQLTMISPMHFVGSNHYKPSIGAPIRFLCSNGVVREFVVASHTAIPNSSGQNSDLFIGTLATPIPESCGIKYHPYLNLSAELDYYNLPLIVLGRTTLGGAGILDRVRNIASASTNSTRVLRFTYNPTSGEGSDCYFQGGDSGSPIFIDHNGVPVLVGTNSLSFHHFTGSIQNFANFIPHYVDKLNAQMEIRGYRMTKAIPGNTTLGLEYTKPTLIRAGHDFEIHLFLKNSGSNLAENIKLKSVLSSSVSVSAVTGSSWFNNISDQIVDARKAKLDGDAGTSLTIRLNITKPGTYRHQVTFYSDQSTTVTESFEITVAESFVSWAEGLSDVSLSGDEDRDGISNLLEYAFGGNPAKFALNLDVVVDEKRVGILPRYTITDGVHKFSYLRRRDHIVRAISYSLRSSTCLSPGHFSDASSFISETVINSINDDLEQVTYILQPSESSQFFNLAVALNEHGP